MEKKSTLFSYRKHILFCLLAIGITTVQAQTDYYVSNTGNNNSDGLTPATAKATIPAVISVAGDGAVVHIANGTYTLTATLYFNHELTVIGESEAGVIINTSGTPSGTWAINLNRSNSSLSNCTIIPNGVNGGFPVHVSANTGNPLPVLANISLNHITINGARKTAFDCNAIDNLNLSYLTAAYTSNGNGIQVSGCKNVAADHIATNHNSWGGFAVYVSKPYPSGVGRGSDQVVIDASTSDFADAPVVYSQNESGLLNTNITVNGFDYLVSNAISAAGYTFYYPDQTTAVAAALALTNPASSVVREISSGSLSVAQGMSIQTAVNNAAVNTLVKVGAGEFHEDVNINKSITLLGAGMNATTVYGVIGGGGATFQISANAVVIDGFGISRDGNNTTDWNNTGLNFGGIAIANVGNAEIRNCKLFGNRTGIDINRSSGNFIHNNIISDNRTGLIFRNQTDNTRVMENEIDNNWTMGILFLDASSGTNSPIQSASNSNFSENHISGNWYGQVVERQAGGSLPAPGTNLKNFTCNWYGTLQPLVSTANSTEPGYATQIPVAYGGTATAPGGQPDILGAGSANIVYQPYLTVGTDNDPSTPGFQPVPNSCASPVSEVTISHIVQNTCFGGSGGSVTITYANGIGDVTYSLDNGAAVPVTGSPVTITGLAAGAHTITISDAVSASTLTVTITQPAHPLEAQFTFTPIQCNGGLSTQNVTITGGTAPYTMQNQDGGVFISGAQEGVTYGGNTGNTYAATYVYTITDANGCTYQLPVTITQPDPIQVTYSATPITCNGGLSTESISITGGTAPYTVKNQNGGVLISGASAGVTYHGNTYAASYTYTVTDANGCSYVFSSVITQPAALVVSANATPVTCNGLSTVTITATGGTAPYAGTGNFSVSAGTYTYTVTDAGGCSKTVSVTPVVIPDNEKPVITRPGNYGVTNDPGTCGAVINLSTPVATDNCQVASVSNDHPSAYFPIGTTTVTWKAIDNSGNISDTVHQTIVVIDNERPEITDQPAQVFCAGAGNAYTIPVLNASDHCGTVTISYVITGATNRSGSGNNASGNFLPGLSQIHWTVKDASGNTSTSTTSVTINPLPAANLTVSGPDVFCKDITVSAVNAGAGAAYQWMLGNTPVASTPSVSLGQNNADGLYSLTVTVNGCTGLPATYLYRKQNLVNSYTVLALKGASFGENNTVASGSVGVVDWKGSASFRRNSSVNTPGSFVKAAKIKKDGQNIHITQPVYAAATGITLPVMYINHARTYRLSDREVHQNSVSTVSGNYRNLILKKGSRTTLTGNTFGTIRVEQGAQVTFTDNTLQIDRLEVLKGPRNGYSYVRFAPDTKVLVSGSVSIGSQVYVNPDNYKVTFYLGDAYRDEERFTIKGGDTKVTANIYLPDGKLKVTGGYAYGDYGHGWGDCDRDDDDEKDFGKGNGSVYMTGLFIAEEVESNGKNVIWNSFDCSAEPVPVLNNYITKATQAITGETGMISSEEELKVTVLPNPSTTYFTLKIESKYTTPVNLRVMDAAGRVVDARSKIDANSTLRIGYRYTGGTYFAEMIQGNHRKVIQLIKLNP